MAERKIEDRLREAEIYHSQGLLAQAEDKYREIMAYIESSHSDSSSDKQLLAEIKIRIQVVVKELEEIEKGDDHSPRLSDENQELIQRIFSFSKSKEMAAVEGVAALAGFGQYEKALAEFQSLLDNNLAPKMLVAKNILRCHVSLASPRAAVDQIKEWAEKNTFSRPEIIFLRDFLKDLLHNEALDYSNSDIDLEANLMSFEDEGYEDLFEIYSIRVRFNHEATEEKPVDLNVAYQKGDTVNFLIKAKHHVLSRISRGDIIDRIQCYSTDSLFNTRGIIENIAKIHSGPRRGDYSVELRLNEA